MSERIFPTGTAVHQFVPRDEWEALPAHGELEPLTVPLDKVYITLTTDSRPCDSTESCTQVLRELQKKDIDSGEPDIRYNFLIGGDGKIYEGRGWTNKPALAKTKDEYSDKTLDIAYIGNHDDIFMKFRLRVIHLQAIVDNLLKEGEKLNYIIDKEQLQID